MIFWQFVQKWLLFRYLRINFDANFPTSWNEMCFLKSVKFIWTTLYTHTPEVITDQYLPLYKGKTKIHQSVQAGHFEIFLVYTGPGTSSTTYVLLNQILKITWQANWDDCQLLRQAHLFQGGRSVRVMTLPEVCAVIHLVNIRSGATWVPLSTP